MYILKKYFLPVLILSVLFSTLVPVLSVKAQAQLGSGGVAPLCKDNPAENKFCTYESARSAARDVPTCTGSDGEDPTKCCPKPVGDNALVQCGRNLKCEYQVKVNKGTDQLNNTDDIYILDKTVVLRTVDPDNMCKFDDLMHLVNNIINFILFALALPIAAIMFAYAGFTLITAGSDNAGARTKAKGIFWSATIGLVLAFVAYLIVKFLLKTLGYSGGWIGF